MKNINVWSDGGVITTDDDGLDARLRLLRNHGMSDRDTVAVMGYNSRLDTIQAVVGNWLIPNAVDIANRRIANARYYDEQLGSIRQIRIPPRTEGMRIVFHLYIVFAEERDALLTHCVEKGIEAKVHYPVPMYRQPALAHLRYREGDFPVSDAAIPAASSPSRATSTCRARKCTMSSKPSGRSTVAAEHSVPRREIPYVNLAAQYAEEREALLPIIDGVMRSGNYIGGEAVERLEAELAAFVGVEHAVALNSGTDALVLGLAALGIGPGDEAITPPNSFVASTAVIVHLRAKPVFVDVLPDQNIDPGRIEAAITPRTKAIMPVHLTGRMARMDEIKRIADKHGLAVIEDAAQAIGSKYAGRMSGSASHVGCFSMHPLKNLNACDGVPRHQRRDGLGRRAIETMAWSTNTVTRFGYVSEWTRCRQRSALPAGPARRVARRLENAQYDALLNRQAVFVPGACRRI